jgi:Flp pilus assembly pilin Flp
VAAGILTDRRRGATVIELLVVLALVSVIMIVAAGLIGAVGRVWNRSARDGFEGDATRAVAQLHRDALGTRTVVAVVGPWSGDELRLSQYDGSTITWRMSGTTLERVVRSYQGDLIRRQDIARPVVAWRWRLVAPGVLDASVRTNQTWDRYRTVRVALRGRDVTGW